VFRSTMRDSAQPCDAGRVSEAEGRGFEPHRPLLVDSTRVLVAGLLVALGFAALPLSAFGNSDGTGKHLTRVYVTEFEFGFKLSRQTVPAGKVTFVMRNNGAIIHNFDLIGVKVGSFLVPGQAASMTAILKRGEYTYVCSVKYHAAQGMQGTLYVR
jgi:plastocyanin